MCRLASAIASQAALCSCSLSLYAKRLGPSSLRLTTILLIAHVILFICSGESLSPDFFTPLVACCMTPRVSWLLFADSSAKSCCCSVVACSCVFAHCSAYIFLSSRDSFATDVPQISKVLHICTVAVTNLPHSSGYFFVPWQAVGPFCP